MTELEQVEYQIDMNTKIRKLRDNVVKLMANEYFKDVIEEAYFKEEAARLVMTKSSHLSVDQQRIIDNMQYGIGGLYNWLQEAIRRGGEADDAIGAHEQTREEILSEEITV
jgi:hypothetical protein